MDYKPCSKKFFTSIQITVESVPTVEPLMRIEPVEGAESIFANFTAVRFFSCVDSIVHFETVGRKERFAAAARFTLELKFTKMFLL